MAAQSADERQFVDHYAVLGFHSGEEGSKKQIEKAYRKQSRVRHPDKRPDDPDATADFQRLTSSFEVLRDEASRRAFDAVLRSRRDRAARASIHDAKRQKLATDLEERERAAASAVTAASAKRKEESVAEELKRELAEFQARIARNASSSSPLMPGNGTAEENGCLCLDKEKMLKVSWYKDDAAKLRGLFERFGRIDDIVIKVKKGSKRREGFLASAIIVMSTKDAAAEALKSMSGHISNPSLVLPLQTPSSTSTPTTANYCEPLAPSVGFQDYEASIMKKLEKGSIPGRTGSCCLTGFSSPMLSPNFPVPTTNIPTFRSSSSIIDSSSSTTTNGGDPPTRTAGSSI